MASWKARKGNPFERLIAYNLKLLNFEVERIDDNTKGIDIIARKTAHIFVIECKFHKKFSWNEIEKIFEKTKREADLKFTSSDYYYTPIFIFKSNQQPVLVAYEDQDSQGLNICTFQSFFNLSKDWQMQKIPKGYKVWKDK